MQIPKRFGADAHGGLVSIPTDELSASFSFPPVNNKTYGGGKAFVFLGCDTGDVKVRVATAGVGHGWYVRTYVIKSGVPLGIGLKDGDCQISIVRMPLDDADATSQASCHRPAWVNNWSLPYGS